jgi:hypothetical protein
MHLNRFEGYRIEQKSLKDGESIRASDDLPYRGVREATCFL